MANTLSLPTPLKNSRYAEKSLGHYWILKFRPAEHLVTDKGTKYPNTERPKCCPLFFIRQSPKNSYDLGTNKLAEVEKKTFGTDL